METVPSFVGESAIESVCMRVNLGIEYDPWPCSEAVARGDGNCDGSVVRGEENSGSVGVEADGDMYRCRWS